MKRCFVVSSSPLDSSGCTPPVIVTQPQSQLVDSGLSVTLSVLATGSDPKTYQWQKDTINISGATSASYVVVYANMGDIGSYRVVVTNACGTVISNSAVLLVTDGACIVPLITVHPASQLVDYGTDVTFSFSVTGTGPFTYQWQRNGIDLPGETDATLSVIYASDFAEGYYRVIVTNACGTATSASALLVVNAQATSGCVAPIILSHPASQSVLPGVNVLFTVSVGGSSPFTYQWRKNGVNIPGAINSSYPLIYVLEADEGTYSVSVTNACGTSFSVPALLLVENDPPTGDGGFGAGGGNLFS